MADSCIFPNYQKLVKLPFFVTKELKFIESLYVIIGRKECFEMGIYRSVNSKLIIATLMFFTVALSGRSVHKYMIPRVLP